MTHSLETLAIKCRRHAAVLGDERARNSLLRMAREYEEQSREKAAVRRLSRAARPLQKRADVEDLQAYWHAVEEAKGRQAARAV